MTDLLEAGSLWLENQRHQHRTIPVRYVRGGDSVEVQATIGRTVFRVDNGRGILERIESRDFLMRTMDLAISGQATLPARGDKVRETKESVIYVYEVMAPGGEPHYRYSDPYRNTLRIHTKLVATEVVP